MSGENFHCRNPSCCILFSRTAPTPTDAIDMMRSRKATKIVDQRLRGNEIQPLGFSRKISGVFLTPSGTDSRFDAHKRLLSAFLSRFEYFPSRNSENSSRIAEILPFELKMMELIFKKDKVSRIHSRPRRYDPEKGGRGRLGLSLDGGFLSYEHGIAAIIANTPSGPPRIVSACACVRIPDAT